MLDLTSTINSGIANSALRLRVEQMRYFGAIIVGESENSLKIALFGRVLYHFEIAQFLLSFFWLYRAQIPLQEALEISLESLNNLALKNKAKGIFESISCGVSVNEAFCKSGLFGSLGNQLLSAAHNEAGFLESLEVLLELHKEEFQNHSESLLAWIEPLMILTLGLLVLWLALGIFLPLWELPLQMQMMG